jgi:hypothetical protein
VQRLTIIHVKIHVKPPFAAGESSTSMYGNF